MESEGLSRPYRFVRTACQCHIEGITERVYLPDVLRVVAVVRDEAESQHLQHAFEKKTVNLRKGMAAVDNDRAEQDAVGGINRLPVPIFGDFVPVTDQHVIQASGDVFFLVHLAGFVLPDLFE